MARAEPFPWDEAMAFAFKVLRLSPAELWALTPRELALAMQPFVAGRSAPSRNDFETLSNIYPDGEM